VAAAEAAEALAEASGRGGFYDGIRSRLKDVPVNELIETESSADAATGDQQRPLSVAAAPAADGGPGAGDARSAASCPGGGGGGGSSGPVSYLSKFIIRLLKVGFLKLRGALTALLH